MATANAGSNDEPGPSNPTAAKAVKRKSDKARSSPATTDALDPNGAKPLARAVLVCKRCRSKKIKCDQAFPACGSCVKAGEPCVGIDSATGREVSRSYIVDLELQVAELRAQNAELERLLAERAASRPSQEASLGLKRPLEHVKHEFPLDRSESASSPDVRPSKRLASTPRNEHGQESPNHLLPGLVLGPAGVEVVPSKLDDQTSPSILRPSFGRLNSHASGLSPARLLCQAIQQSAQAGLRIRDPGSSARAKRSGAQTLGEDLSRRAKSNAREPSQHPVESKEEASKAEGRTGSPHSGSATPSDSKKNSPFDDGDPMQYATATETADITVPAPEQALKPSPLPAPFPPLSIARKLIDAYFERVNPQLPILDRSSFMARFERACKIGLERARAKLSSEEREQQGDDDDKVAIELQPADGHLFHLVFAIAAAMGWTRSNWSAENHHEAAMRFLDPRRLANSGMDGGVGAIMGRDALEQLQCLLLTALYSIMRPMKPGVWYCLGVALRLTTGIGLYTEMPGVLEASTSIPQDSSESLIERKRRLFWCSYALDRQVCVHLGRPFGIADSDIKVNLPWVDNQQDMIKVPINDGQGRAQGADASAEDDFDSSTEIARREAASTLAALQSSTVDQASSGPVSLPKPKDASRWVSLSFFRMRILQSEIQSMLYQNAELPRRFDSYAHWKTDILRRLHAWRRYAPSSKKDLEISGCGYNPIFLELNYQQTLLMVYGLSPRFPNASRKDLANVEECSRSIINMYATLSKEGQMNYTWMTGHNVFIACTSYLYAIWQISATDPGSFRSSVTLGFRNKVDEIHHFAAACDKVLASLQWATAEKCRKCLRTMFYATSMVVEKIDRTASARTVGQPKSAAIQDRPSEDTEDRIRTSGSAIGKTQAHSGAAVDMERTQAHASPVSSRPPPSSSPSAWTLYAQERDWRQSAPNKAFKPALPSPQPEATGPRSWAQKSQGRGSPASNTAWPSDSDAATHRGESGFGRTLHPNIGERSRFASASADPYASDATTPSRGLDMGSTLVDASNSGNAWYGFGSETSPKMLFPDSPSNIDISSLMATSAMELDALFREAGLSAGPSGEQRGWMDAGANVQQGAPMSAADFGFGGSREQTAASQYGQGERPSSFYDSIAGGTHQVDGRGKWALDAGPNANVGRHNGGVTMVDGEGFDTDWEALGFGYRMATLTQHSGISPMFADSAGQPQQHDFVNVRGGAQQPGQPAYVSREAPGFDQRYLDSHMGF